MNNKGVWYNLLQPAGWGFWSQQGTIPNPATSDVDRLLADGPAIVEQVSAFVEAPDKLFGWVQDKIKEVGELTVDRWPPTAVAA